ncbi:hypothetical protein P3L10_019944 [Capsicum annuum]
MAKKIEIIPLMTIMVMLILISHSKLVYSILDEKCFRECVRACKDQKPQCDLVCAKVCEDPGLINYSNLGCSVNKCASLIQDDKQWKACMNDCYNNYCKKIRA